MYPLVPTRTRNQTYLGVAFGSMRMGMRMRAIRGRDATRRIVRRGGEDADGEGEEGHNHFPRMRRAELAVRVERARHLRHHDRRGPVEETIYLFAQRRDASRTRHSDCAILQITNYGNLSKLCASKVRQLLASSGNQF